MRQYGVGTSIPSNEKEQGAETLVLSNNNRKNGTAPKGIHFNKVPTPRAEKNNGTKVPTPRRFLPHVDLIGYYQFVTFRTHDSIDDYLKRIRNEDISSREQEYKIDQYIDLSAQGCYLNANVLEYLKEFFISKNKSFYDLVSFCVMPNHVHILFKQNDELKKIMKTLKGSTSFQINKMLGRKGTFWEENYYDTVIRDENHFNTVYGYIKNNPIKAELENSKDRFYGIYE